MFLMHIVTAWVLWRIFYWKWPYAIALAVLAGAAHWFLESRTDSTWLPIVMALLLVIVLGRFLNRESILRPTSRGGGGRYEYRLDDKNPGRGPDDGGPPRDP